MIGGGRMKQPVTQQLGPGITVTDTGMNSRELITLAVASSTLIVSIGVAVAVWKIATGIQWALIILSAGSAVQMVLVGVGIMCRQALAGRAMLIDAKGRASAARIIARVGRARTSVLVDSGTEKV